jgi:hypothetical protein
MSDPTPGTHQKALSINLDDKIYGTIAEIGAGQEVAGWFFRVGAAAGSVAKAISAYDMQVSDEIYGQSERYVSRGRLESMLDKEYTLLTQRLGKKRDNDTRFFAFCDTVAARNFAGTNECQGWVGLRFCAEGGGEPNTIILHINMLDDTNVAQQEAVGVLGVNLIYSAFFASGEPEKALSALADNLGSGRVEVDLVDAYGPAFTEIDAASIGIIMVQKRLADAVLYGSDGRLHPPTEFFRKRPAIIKRTSSRYASADAAAELQSAQKMLADELSGPGKPPVTVAEFSVNSVHASGGSNADENLRHVQKLLDQHEWVLLTRLRQSYKLCSYLRRYSQQPLRFVMGVSTFAMLLSEKFYLNSDCGLLEATGKLFSHDVKMYVRPMQVADFRSHLKSVNLDPDQIEIADNSDTASVLNIAFPGALRHLHQYLMESGFAVNLVDVD